MTACRSWKPQEQFHTVFQRVANTAASPAGEDSISLVFYETGETNVVQPEIGQIGEQKAPEVLADSDYLS